MPTTAPNNQDFDPYVSISSILGEPSITYVQAVQALQEGQARLAQQAEQQEGADISLNSLGGVFVTASNGRTYYATDMPKMRKSTSGDIYESKLAYLRSLNKDNVKDIPFMKEGQVYNKRGMELYVKIDDATALYAVLKDNNNLYSNDITLETFKANIELAYFGVVVNSLLNNGELEFDINERFYEMTFSNRKTEDLIKWSTDNMYFDKDFISKVKNVTFKYLLENDDTGHLDQHATTAPFNYSLLDKKSNTAIYKAFCDLCDNTKRLALRIIQDHQRRHEIQNRRPNTSSDRFRSTKLGEYVKHRVPFAVELECYGTNQTTVAKMSREIAREWGVSRDGSLTSNLGYPIEIQSPILSGLKGEQNIVETCKILNDLNFQVDRTCGMHVHFGCGDAFIRSQAVRDGSDKPSNLISLYLFHRLFEDAIVSFLPSTRRVNHYCGQFKNGVEYRGMGYELGTMEHAFSVMENINTLQQFELYWYKARNANDVYAHKQERYTVSRYMGVNFHSLLKDNHIEIRYHSGTKNYEKILYWVNLHGKIVEMCASGVINQKMLKEIKAEKLNLEQLTMRMFTILNMDKDTVEYLMDRQAKLIKADSEQIDEIAISKTKNLEII